MCLCADMHTHTHTHTYTLLYTYRYACMCSVYFNQPRPDTTLGPGTGSGSGHSDWAIGRHLAVLQSGFRLFFLYFFSHSPTTAPTLSHCPPPVSGPFMLAFIYLLAAIAFSIFRLQIGKVQTQQRTRCRKRQHRNGDWPIPKSSPSQTQRRRGEGGGGSTVQTGHEAYAAAQKLQINPTTTAAEFNWIWPMHSGTWWIRHYRHYILFIQS